MAKKAVTKKPVWLKVNAPDCGWITKNPGALTKPQIKRIVLTVAADGGPPLSPSTPDDTPVTGGLRVGNGDQIWPLAQDCMRNDRFQSDGLRIKRFNVI